MDEINKVNYNEINNPTNLSLNSQALKTTPYVNNASPSNEILYFSINQDSD